MDIIKAEHLSFTYPGDEETRPVQALKDVSFSIPEGSFTAILGHNGSGKSTLAKLLCMISLPDSGRRWIAGREMTAADATEADILAARREVGMVFQNPDNQIVATIVEDDVAFGPENLGVDPSEIRRRVDDALKRVDMYDFRRFEPHNLSGGQKQRVAIAGVIAMQPACIVLDEPTAMLDPRGRKDVMETVKMLNREHGITVVLITHYMDEAAQADRVVVMDHGKVLLDGTPRQVFARGETLKQAGLDVPQATALAALLQRDGLDVPADVLTVDELADAIAAAKR